MTARLSHPFVDAVLQWHESGIGYWRATFNHLTIGGYSVSDVDDSIGRVWFGSAKMVESMSDEPPVTEDAARAWIEATFREWVRLAAEMVRLASAEEFHRWVVEAAARSRANDLPASKKCPTCNQTTYRSDGVAFCVDHDPSDDGKPIEDLDARCREDEPADTDDGDPHEEQAWP